MVLSLGRWAGAFYLTFHAQHGLFIMTRVTHMKFSVPYGERGVLAYVGIQVHYIVILYRLSLTYRVVKNHSPS